MKIICAAACPFSSFHLFLNVWVNHVFDLFDTNIELIYWKITPKKKEGS